MSHREQPGSRSTLGISMMVLALFLGTAFLVSATPLPSAKSLTVGEFAILVAHRVQQAGAPSPSTPEAAVASLEKLGIRLRPELSSPLTEGDAVELFRQFGISLQARIPGNLLDRDRAASLIAMFGGNLASTADRADAVPAFPVSVATAGSPTPEDIDPAYCQTLWPLPDCQGLEECNPCLNCCKNILGLGGKVCGPLCARKNLVISPDEPTP